MTILVTGAAGFIGSHVCQQLLNRGEKVLGVDNINTYYDVHLKEARLKPLKEHPHFTFHLIDIADKDIVIQLFQQSPESHRMSFLLINYFIRGYLLI